MTREEVLEQTIEGLRATIIGLKWHYELTTDGVVREDLRAQVIENLDGILAKSQDILDGGK